MSGLTERTASRSFAFSVKRVEETGGLRERVGRWLIEFGAPLLVVAVLAALRVPWVNEPLVTQDETIILVYAQQILDGHIPHRDFYTVYGPGVFGLTAASFAVFGSSLLVERLLGLLLQAVVVCGLYRLTVGRGRRTAVMLCLLSILGLTPLGLVAYAWVGGLVCIVWGLVLLERDRRETAAFAVLALAALFRPEMSVPALAAGLPFLTTPARRWRALLGAAIGLAPSVMYFSTWGRRAVDSVVLERGLVNAKLEGTATSALMLLVAATILVILLGIAVFDRSAQNLSRAMLVLLFMPQLVQRTDLEHFAYVAGVAAPLALAAILGSPRASRCRSLGLLRWSLAITLAMLIAPSRLFIAPTPSVSYEVEGRSIRVAPGAVHDIDRIRRSVLGAAAPGSRVFVGTQDMSRPSVAPVQLYFLLPELRADAYYLEMPIGISNASGQVLADDVRRSDVLVLADFSPKDSQRLAPHVPEGPRDADDVVHRYFCPATQTPGLRILVRCGTRSG